MAAAAQAPGGKHEPGTRLGPGVEQPAAAPVVGVCRMLAAMESALAGRRIEAARVLVAASGDELLSLKGVTCVGELTATQRTRWRAEAKAAAVLELQAATGRGQQECQHLVALACAPGRITPIVIEALDAGLATFEQARAFWRRCARLDPEAGEAVATALFGTEADLAAVERLTPGGALAGDPWQAMPYRAALEREATAAEGVDVAAERTRRREAYAAARLTVQAHEDGTSTLSVTDDLIGICGIAARCDRIARLMRKRGDERTLDQLRAHAARILLLHGTVQLPEGDDPDQMTPQGLEELTRVINGQPAINLQVIVPWDSLTGRPAGPWDDGEDRGRGTAQGRPLRPSGRGAVAQVLGAPGLAGAFITPGHARELALTPGTTLSRLLLDPADGRLVERSIASYRPDADMRRQIVAADVTARVPWTTLSAERCELDHVRPWTGDETGGPTCELNIASLPKTPHQMETLRQHTAVINEQRDLTWTTLLAWQCRTRVHDYRQYLAEHLSAVRIDHEEPADDGPATSAPTDDGPHRTPHELRPISSPPSPSRVAPGARTRTKRSGRSSVERPWTATPTLLTLMRRRTRSRADDSRAAPCRSGAHRTTHGVDAWRR